MKRAGSGKAGNWRNDVLLASAQAGSLEALFGMQLIE